MNVDEVLAKMDALDASEEEIQYIIDENLRVISIPPLGVVLGVEGDKDVNSAKFKMVRYYKGIDLSKFEIRINFANANGDLSYYTVKNPTVTDDTLTFEWLVGYLATKYKGTVRFIVRMITTDASTGEVQQAFDTTVGEAQSLEGLMVDVPTDEKVYDIVEQLKADLTGHVNNLLKTIPEDYNELTKKVEDNTLGISGLKEDLETLNQGGLNLKEDFIDQQVNEWLDKHPEATTTVQDYSLTFDKMVIGTLGYVTPEMFGAVGDGKTDDTGAIQKAIDSVKNGYVLFQRSTYCVSKELQITNKNIIFNNCILKRISNCTVLNFDNSNNFKLSDVTITDNGSTYGNMIVGRGCENVEIKNVTVNSSSPHTNESIGNWAMCLSGNAFHISGLRINNYESGLWADGLHFGYVANSVIEDFVILSGDDSIAITQHELGGTRFENKVSENIKFVNGVVKSAKASPFRLGFDNAGKRSENEIDKCYHKNILFENIECEGGYFLRVEYISHDSGVLPISDENIKFANISYKQDRIVTAYPPFFVSKEYSLVNYSFNNCNIDCSFATEEMTQPFSYIASNIENEKSLLAFSDCLFNFSNIRGIVGYKINKVKFKNCNFLSNGKKIISIYGSCEFVESDIINYGEEADYFCIINASDNDKTYRLNGCFISNYKQFSNKNEDNHTFLFMDNCYFKTTVNVLSWYGGNVNYNNIIKGDRKLNSSKDIFLYVPANLSIKYDLSSYAYASLLVLSNKIETYEIIITSGGSIMLPVSKRQDAINMLKSAGVTISVENRILTINNIEDVYKNVFIKCYAQTN